MTPTLAENPTLAKAMPFGLRPIRTSAMRSPHRPDRSLKMSAMTRRKMLGLLPAALLSTALLPSSLQAETCDELLPGLRLCDAFGWTVLPAKEDGGVDLVSASGLAAAIVLTRNLTAEEVSGARWTISHMPISARANVLSTGFFEIGNHLGTSVAYLPRHADPAMVVALSDVIGTDFTLVVSSHETGVNTYSETHQQEHTALLAALRLDFAK